MRAIETQTPQAAGRPEGHTLFPGGKDLYGVKEDQNRFVGYNDDVFHEILEAMKIDIDFYRVDDVDVD